MKDRRYATLLCLHANGQLGMNTFVTHPWIAVDAKTNERMLLNFRKTYLPGEPEVRQMDFEHREDPGVVPHIPKVEIVNHSYTKRGGS